MLQTLALHSLNDVSIFQKNIEL